MATQAAEDVPPSAHSQEPPVQVLLQENNEFVLMRSLVKEMKSSNERNNAIAINLQVKFS